MKLVIKSFIHIFFIFILFQTYVHAEEVDVVRQYVEDNYYKAVPEEVLNKDSIEEIMEGLDPYSTYLTSEEYGEFLNTIERNFTGIGIEVSEHENGIIVLSTFENGPALESGVKAGDLLIEADGTSLKGMSLEEATLLIKGEEGTSVSLKVIREGQDDPIEFSVTRKEISLPSINYKKLAGNIGYIQMYSFSSKSTDEMTKAIQDLEGVDGWILDIRNNGGGYLKSALELAGFFPKVETALVMKDRYNQIDEPSVKQNVTFDKPVSLLINGGSASASEIIAGVLKDYESATLYGQTTFGKGLAQLLIELPSGAALKLSASEFFTPKGDTINQKGISPDVKTEVGRALDDAHRDFLLRNNEYSKLVKESKMSRSPVFTIETEEPISIEKIKENAALYELGGNLVGVDILPTSYTTFKVIPSKSLKEKDRYLFKVNSGEKGYSIEFTTSDKIDKEFTYTPFTDVKKDHYFTKAIKVLYSEGIVKGIGSNKYAPYHYLTREDAAVMFVRALGLNTDHVKDPGFKDLKKGSYYYNAVAAMKEKGYINGRSDDEFGVGDILTREEMAALISRAFKLEKKNDEVPFSDVGHSPFKSEIIKIYQRGITTGSSPTTFSPYKAVTRGEFATFLYRAIISQYDGELKVESVE